jgi:hypothetical protein
MQDVEELLDHIMVWKNGGEIEDRNFGEFVVSNEEYTESASDRKLSLAYRDIILHLFDDGESHLYRDGDWDGGQEYHDREGLRVLLGKMLWGDFAVFGDILGMP